jgi:hypothetical protein
MPQKEETKAAGRKLTVTTGMRASIVRPSWRVSSIIFRFIILTLGVQLLSLFDSLVLAVD